MGLSRRKALPCHPTWGKIKIRSDRLEKYVLPRLESVILGTR